jgi:hypothetical protein
MKNIMSRFLAVLVALLVLCAPIGAMAEETPSVTLALSNLSLKVADQIDINLGATARLDVTADMENGTAAGTLTALAGNTQALKGGFQFNMSDKTMIAALDGVSDAVLIPLDDAMEAMDDIFAGEQAEKVARLQAAAENLMALLQNKSDILAGAVGEKLGAWLQNVQTEGYKGETTITVRGAEIAAQQFDYKMTVEELGGMLLDLFDAVKGDAALAGAVQELVNAIADLTDAEAPDLFSADTESLRAQLADVPAYLGGSLYLCDNGFVLDLNIVASDEAGAPMIPVNVTVLIEDEAYIAFSFDTSAATPDDPAVLNAEFVMPTDGTPKFNYSVKVNNAGTDAAITIDGDFTNGANFTFAGETTNTYSFDGETYTSANAFALNYVGTSTNDENGMAFNGRLTFYVNSDGMEITLGADTLASLNSASTVDFNMPINVINVEEADADTLNALSQEYAAALQQGLGILMTAPGAQDLLNMMN